MDAFFREAAISFVSGTFSFVLSWYWFQKRLAAHMLELKHQKDELNKRTLEILERDVAILKQSITPISAAFQAMLVKELTHFHTPEMDALLVKLGPPYSLSWADEQRLVELLQERTSEVSGLLTESERDAASILPAVIKRVKSELVIQKANKWLGVDRRSDVQQP